MLYQLFIARGIPLSSYLIPGEESWALVTGCTDGIGKQFAIQLAQHGFNIILVSRNPEKLELMKQKVQELGRLAEVVQLDFGSDVVDYQQLTRIVQTRQVTVLVNNVGISSPGFKTFVEDDETLLLQMLRVNCESAMRVTKRVLPQMMSRRKGLVLNIGSGGGMNPIPYITTYGATKAFLHHWGQSLAKEVEKDNVTVQTVIAYEVLTSMSPIQKEAFARPCTEAYVKSVLSKIGLRCGSLLDGPFLTVPYPAHALMHSLTSLLPSKDVVMQVAVAAVTANRRAIKRE
jgi:17beta-estradiol 17-dehydrogenase / very-long-chain 3-oxoacyl-CoA reductase